MNPRNILLIMWLNNIQNTNRIERFRRRIGEIFLLAMWTILGTIALAGTIAYGQTAPLAPTNLMATATSSTSITVSWTNTDPNATTVVIERQTLAPGGPTSFALLVQASSQLTSYLDQTAAPLTTYNYQAYAISSGGNSAYSNQSSATTLAPTCPPAALVATPVSPTEIDLQWNTPLAPDPTTGCSPSTSSIDQTVNTIVIERQALTTGAAIPFVQIASLSGTTSSYHDNNGGSGLPSQVAFNYRVYAISPRGNSIYSNTAETTTNAPPPTPQPFQATTLSFTEIDLSWNNSDPTVTSYKIVRQALDGSQQTFTVTPISNHYFPDVNLSPGTQYNYAITAHSPTGDSAPALATAKTFARCAPSDTNTLTCDPASQRYFKYKGQTLALVGMSGEYLPYVAEGGTQFNPVSGASPSCAAATPVSSYCTLDKDTSDPNHTSKYQQCIDTIKKAGLNKMQLWVGLDFSPGTLTTTAATPFLDEQPFQRSGNIWMLGVDANPTFDEQYFTNLYNLVNYAASKDVMVEVTLFVPFSGDPSTGPWTAQNNSLYLGFSNNDYFVEADCSTTLSPLTSYFDCNANDQVLRQYQVAMVQHIIDKLYPLNNYYYQLSNEPDLDGHTVSSPDTAVNVLAWHNFMANYIWQAEDAKGGNHHLIAVNYTYGCSSCQPMGNIDLTTTDANSHIDIINSHYVTVTGPGRNIVAGGLPPSERFGAIDLVRGYNLYTNGKSASSNTKIWGFNEDNLAGFCFHATPEGVRAQGWEFMLNGGGAFDEYAYDWGNVDPTHQNDPDTNVTIPTQLGGLAAFVNSNVIGTTRTPDDTSSWFIVMDASGQKLSYGSGNNYWAATQGNDRYLLYLHHSNLVAGGTGARNTGYAPICSPSCTSQNGGYQTTLNVQLAGCSSGQPTYTADWFMPANLTNTSQPSTTVNLPPGTSFSLTSPRYNFDIALRLKKTCNATLTIGKSGTNTGTVTSSPTAINCGATCAADFASGTSVTLTAAPAYSVFSGWSGGGCTGAGACTVSMTADTSVTAVFTPLPLPAITSISPNTGSTGGGATVTINGTNFIAGATVTLAGIPANSVNVVSSTKITALAPAHPAAGTVTVVVTNPDAQTGTLANSFNYFVPINNISWVKPSGVSFGPANTLTVDGSALNGNSPVQTIWRDVTVNGAWNTIATLSTPDGGGSWANTIPTSNYCHSYDVYANYLNVTSPTFHYVGVGSSYCSENAYVNWIEPPSLAGFGPAGSLVVQGNATGASAGTTVAFFWSDVTAGTGWTQASPAAPDASGTWYNYIPNVTSWHQYNVYVVYDAFDTRNGQGVCTYAANGGTTWCPR